VRPLAGGLYTWCDRGYAVSSLERATA